MTTTEPEDRPSDQELDASEWSAYLDNPFVLNNCRHFLERLWTRQFGEPT
jgi:hypothetical protein